MGGWADRRNHHSPSAHPPDRPSVPSPRRLHESEAPSGCGSLGRRRPEGHGRLRQAVQPQQPRAEIKDEVRPLPGEPVVQKSVSSAFIGTALEADLRRRGWTTLVVVGMQTNMCVSTTARMAGNLGFTTYVVSDATATFDNTGPDGRRYASELLHDVALADLNGEFSTVVDTKTLLAAL